MDALLSGIKILDFTYLLPGPFATMILSDLGAEVLRVESHTRMDMARLAPPYVDSQCTVSCMHAFLNRNKKSIALDLKYPESIAIIRRLIAEQGYDVVIEQFRPGAMGRLGLSYDTLSETNPGLIYCSITGYGQTGPLRDRAGHDINYLSLAGVMGYSGTKKAGPSLMGIQVADVGSGSNNAAIGILAALIGRMKTGKGRYIDVSMTDGMFPYHVVSALGCLVGGVEPSYESEILNGGSLYGFYETRDGRYLSFGGLEPQFLSAFLQALGLGHYIARLLEPDVGGELKERVRGVIRSQDLSHWEEVFSTVDACVEPVLSVLEATSSPHAKARGIVVQVPGPDGTPIPQVAAPIKFSDYEPAYHRSGPALGQDTADVLTSLGMTGADIADLKSKGIIGGV
ncbi:MAG TPA: CaiB/BaiF CoA-transferase family protein [Deltaproteobacteria bacterium]|nr:CaiB/BaiF CoA-transferase family protein [Deltaproteobacteria bacterium]HPR53735.1 CaiB/BaiF CoA-transferase family protein [Deltaproteobacteria bacterium]HXK46752.1 CaiB/BaiF CoA-transferase family protein [Deltaproteobacteria bacterium]